jgi:preprotein translocase subunit SecA
MNQATRLPDISSSKVTERIRATAFELLDQHPEGLAWNAHLRRWEVDLETRERRVELEARLAAQPNEAESKVGRNERCPCGSGLKYKHCHDASRGAGYRPS